VGPLRHVAGLALLALAAGPSAAQTAGAALTGTVRDESATPVAGAVVQARAAATGAVRAATTDERGTYRIELLAPDSWTVVARLADGSISAPRAVRVGLQQTMRQDFTVEREAAERVTVRAESPLVDRKTTGAELRVESAQLDGLPLAGRAFTDLALLDASVRQAAPGNFYGERGSVFVVNGQSGRSNAFLVDGLDNNDQTSGTALNAFFSQQVIQEFVLSTHQYAPEFGRASGGVLNIVTKRGTNQRRWDAFFQGTAADWSAPGSFVEDLPATAGQRATDARFQGGFSLGGPLRQDRAFYFLAYEHQGGDQVQPYTGVDRTGAAGGRLEAPRSDDNLFLRTDFNLGDAHTLMLRLSADDRSDDGVNVAGIVTPEAGFTIDERDWQLAGSLTSIFGPRLIGETRVLAGTSRFDQQARSSLTGVTRPSGIFGGNNLNRQQRDERRFQLVHNLTWQRGPHRFKFGADVTHSITEVGARFNPRGNFLYDYDFPFQLGDCSDVGAFDVILAEQAADAAGVEFDGRVPCSGDANGNQIPDEPANIYSYPLVYALIDGQPRTTLRDTRLALFAQDQWEINPRWLLDYGLRYDVSSYHLPASARVDSVVPNGGAGRDTDNLAPRLGFTYLPANKLVIRGGAGVFYDKLVLAFPAVAAITSGTQVLLSFNQGFAFEWNEQYVDEQGSAGLLADLQELAESFDQLIMRFSTGTRLDTPYSVQFNIGLERPVGAHGALRADLVRVEGRRLPLMKDLNPVSGLVQLGLDCTAENIDPNLEIGLPCHLADPATGSIAAVVSEGRSWYTGLDLNWRWRRDDAWFRASYTWSRAEDLGFDPLKGGIALPPDSTNLRQERGRSDGDRTHRFVLSGELATLANLRLSGVLQLASGLPFDVTTGQDDNLDGILSDRPAGVPRNAGEDASLEAINAVRDHPVLSLAPIQGLDEPSLFQIDVRLARPFALRGGRGDGELFIQVFNLLDRENAGLIEGRAISPNFGHVIGLAGPPRTVELGLRLGG